MWYNSRHRDIDSRPTTSKSCSVMTTNRCSSRTDRSRRAESERWRSRRGWRWRHTWWRQFAARCPCGRCLPAVQYTTPHTAPTHIHQQHCMTEIRSDWTDWIYSQLPCRHLRRRQITDGKQFQVQPEAVQSNKNALQTPTVWVCCSLPSPAISPLPRMPLISYRSIIFS